MSVSKCLPTKNSLFCLSFLKTKRMFTLALLSPPATDVAGNFLYSYAISTASVLAASERERCGWQFSEGPSNENH